MAEVQQPLQFRGDVQCVVWGGYSSAERCRVVFGREELLLEGADDPQVRDCVQAVQVRARCACTFAARVRGRRLKALPVPHGCSSRMQHMKWGSAQNAWQVLSESCGARAR